RLRHHGVDDAEPHHVVRRDLHVRGGVLGPGGIAPQDRRGAFRRDHAVDGVLQHDHAVGGGNRDGAAGAAFADDRRHIGHADLETGFGRARDRFGLGAFFGADAGISARGVDQRDHRHVEVIRHAHQPGRLAIAFRPRHAEIVLEPAVGVGAFLVADDADALAAEAAEAADDGRVLTVLAVAGERHEVLDQGGDVIEAMRPLRMPRHLRLLPRRQARIELLERLRRLAFDAADFLGDGVAVAVERAQLLDLGLELGHRFFEVEIATHRAVSRLVLGNNRAGGNWHCVTYQGKQVASRASLVVASGDYDRTFGCLANVKLWTNVPSEITTDWGNIMVRKPIAKTPAPSTAKTKAASPSAAKITAKSGSAPGKATRSKASVRPVVADPKRAAEIAKGLAALHVSLEAAAKTPD